MEILAKTSTFNALLIFGKELEYRKIGKSRQKNNVVK